MTEGQLYLHECIRTHIEANAENWFVVSKEPVPEEGVVQYELLRSPKVPPVFTMKIVPPSDGLDIADLTGFDYWEDFLFIYDGEERSTMLNLVSARFMPDHLLLTLELPLVACMWDEECDFLEEAQNERIDAELGHEKDTRP